MAAREIDLDRIIDYKAEYCAVVEKFHISGDNLTGLCPFHKDTHNSFSVDLKTGQWHCLSEDIGGNFITFWARLHHGDDTPETRKAAYKEILERYHIQTEPPKKQTATSGLASYSVEQYSFEKRLPVDFLKEVCRLSTERDRDGTSYLNIPYFHADGRAAATRKRYGNKDFRWKRGSKGEICLYGEWRLPEITKVGWVILVEGESDTQSLWHLGLPALGVPGASMFKPEHTEALDGLKVYLHQEPDHGGDTFVAKVCRGLKDGNFDGQVFRWSCERLGTKDPSDLYINAGKEEAAAKIKDALQGAELVDLDAELIPEAIQGAPVNLRQPEGWIYSERGIAVIDEKRFAPVTVCRTPIILTQRLKSLETGDEKIEAAFKRDGKWQTGIYERDTIFTSRGIVTLAKLGCTITSENARQVVKFLGALEAENIDIIPRNDAAGTFGWQPGRRFIPGHADGITLDIDPSQRGMAAAYCQNGTLERWVETMRPHRSRDKFRFILAASFAAPLLRIVKQRIFFVYNWGGSKGGKTAALKAALSAWGDPERLMVNFNATQVGLERTAAFYCDLPLGIDERQLAGQSQGQLEKIVYMIASGKGKLRGSKSGGIQTLQEWRTVALATGEEPLSTETSQTGVSTRVLEIYGGPFDNEQDAAAMHQQAALDCGWAGPAFVGKILETDERRIVEVYEDLERYIRAVSSGKNGAYISGIAAVALADALIDTWFFGGEWESAIAAAKRMAERILVEQVENNAQDVNENAVQFIVDWALSNKAFFGTKAIGTCYGDISESGNTVYIFPSILNDALKKAGYSARKTMKHLADQGLITTDIDPRSGKKQYSVVRRFETRIARFVEFHIGDLAENKDPIDDADELAGSNGPEPTNYRHTGFSELTDVDQEELPF